MAYSNETEKNEDIRSKRRPHIQKVPQAVQNVFSIKNPLMRLMAVRDMENELVRERNNPTPAPVQTPATKVEQTTQAPINNLSKAVGKPGSQIEAVPDAFDNTDSLRELLRSM